MKRLVSFLAAGCVASAAGAAPTPQQNARLMDACLKAAKQRSCQCLVDASSSLDELHAEMMIALTAKDKAQEAAVRANPAYDEAAYQGQARPVLKQSFSCIVETLKKGL